MNPPCGIIWHNIFPCSQFEELSDTFLFIPPLILQHSNFSNEYHELLVNQGP